MRRSVMGLALTLLLVLCLGATAVAHAMSIVAEVTPVGDGKVTIKLVDVYEVPLPVTPIEVTWSGEQGRRSLPLTEGPEGAYTAELPGGPGELLIETTIGGDLFKARVPAPETALARVPMTQYERGAKVWLPLAFFGFFLLAIGGGAAYLLRRPAVRT